jgi:hypothetical protein
VHNTEEERGGSFDLSRKLLARTVVAQARAGQGRSSQVRLHGRKMTLSPTQAGNNRSKQHERALGWAASLVVSLSVHAAWRRRHVCRARAVRYCRQAGSHGSRVSELDVHACCCFCYHATYMYVYPLAVLQSLYTSKGSMYLSSRSCLLSCLLPSLGGQSAG